MTDSDEVDSMMNVVVLYDTLDSGCRAKGYLDRLQLRSGGELQFNLKLWRFDMIELLQPQELYPESSIQAEIVIIALQPGCALPEPIVGWLNARALRREIDDVVLVLLQRPAADGFMPTAAARNTLHTLRRFAARQGLSFQAEWEDASDAIPAPREELEGPEARNFSPDPRFTPTDVYPARMRHESSG